MSDTLDVLITKVNACANVNSEIIDRIDERLDHGDIISGWTHKLDLQLPSPTGSTPLMFTPAPVKQPLKSILDQWRYEGEPLDLPEDVFNDKLDYNITKYDDLKRLNQKLPVVADKFTRFADDARNRADLRTFLTNLERLQFALGHIEEQTFDKEDTLTDHPAIEMGVDLITQGFELLAEMFHEHKLEVNTWSSTLAGLVELRPLGVTNLSMTNLYLGSKRLTNVPDGISLLTNLTHLVLSNNHLTSVPDGISCLTNLTRLLLNGNQLTSVPDGISCLTNLRNLYLNGNQLTSVPDGISSLTNLTILKLYGNKLTSVSDEIPRLTHLTGLFLSNNQLTSVPDKISRLTNLTTLTLGSNHLVSGQKSSR